MRQHMVMGNWKMNGQKTSVQALVAEILNGLSVAQQRLCTVLPPTIYLPLVQELLRNTQVEFGAQNLYPQQTGAFTGEVSAPMLRDYGCRYVLVGHSERRHLFNESEKFTAEKFHHAKEHDMIPVLCVGETLSERQAGRTEQVIQQQLMAVKASGKDWFEGCIVAYEPVWAIGTGETATPEQAQAVHGFIRNLVATLDENHARALPILYGGSVNENNARALFEMPDVDGGLVGGASLNAQQFVDIVKCIS